MITAFHLGGFFAAHAIWSLSDGDELVPMLAYTTENGERMMERLQGDDLATSVQFGQQKMEENSMNACDAALLFDAITVLNHGKTEALIIELKSYFFPQAKAAIAVPYSRVAGKFSIHKPRLVQWDGCEQFEVNAAFEAFFIGVGGHEKGAAVWNESLDESV